MSFDSDRRIKAFHVEEFDEEHFLRVANALRAVGLPDDDEMVLAVGHGILGHPAAPMKLRQLADVWAVLGDAKVIDGRQRVVFEVI